MIDLWYNRLCRPESPRDPATGALDCECASFDTVAAYAMQEFGLTWRCVGCRRGLGGGWGTCLVALVNIQPRTAV